MDFNTTIDLIIKDLDEVREIIDDLKKYPGVPALQVELAKSKCKSAGEVIALLKNLQNNISEKKETKSGDSVTIKEEISNWEIPEPGPSEEKKIHIKTVKSSQLEETISEEQKQKREKVPETTILADQFSNLTTSFNEQMGSLKREDDVSEILKTKLVTTLTEAIGINDRFLFIREIFNGNIEMYTQAISRLDNAESLSDARAVIMSYTGDDKENEAVKQLLDLLKRKFPANE